MNQSVSIGGRLKDERKRLGKNQTDFGLKGGVTKKTQMLYESGERAPDAIYLAAIASAGADVGFIVTGERDFELPEQLSAEEQTMLDYFRDASKEVRRAALGALLGASPGTKVGGEHSQHSSGIGAVQIGSMGSALVKKRR